MIDLETKYPTAAKLRKALRETDSRFFAKDNLYDAMSQLEKDATADDIQQRLVAEATTAFEEVLYTFIVDAENDPNSKSTPHRLAKMYINELLEGRYTKAPKATAFPNEKLAGGDCPSQQMSDNIYHLNNLLVVQAPFKSLCSHHYQVVDATAYIGILPGKQVIGLSKYTRLVRHVAARGTLQEELTTAIADIIQEKSDTPDIAVVVYGRHGCCEHRGIRVPNSQTATAEMRGLFMEDAALRSEFMSHVKLMREEK